jgi:DNA modification methylase
MQEGSSLRGHIFACTTKTEKECLDRMLFASNKVYENKVMQVKKGDPLFLFNVDSGALYGVFKATSHGAKNIVPEAWNGSYPYQVRVRRNGKTKTFGDAHKILSRLNIAWHKYLEADKLKMLLALFSHETGASWGSLLPDIYKQKLGEGQDILDEKPLIEVSTLWDYPKQTYGSSSKGNNKYPGVTPAFIIYNLLKRYTESGDVVVDPMAGSGTCLDVCKEEKRKCIAFDIAPTRPDISENDARKLPLSDNRVDMVFIDSPYGNNLRYNENELDIGKISAESESFYKELSKVMSECYRILKPGKVLAWLIGDQWVKKRFTPVGFKVYTMLEQYFDTVDIICVVRRGQRSNTGKWHNLRDKNAGSTMIDVMSIFLHFPKGLRIQIISIRLSLTTFSVYCGSQP